MDNNTADQDEETFPLPGEDMSDKCTQAEEEDEPGWVHTQQMQPDSLEEQQRVKPITLQQEILCPKGSDDNPKLPEKYMVGQAVNDGDCFFDSVAKGLKSMKPELDVSVKYLREVCKEFAQRQLDNDESWLKQSLKNEAEQIHEYIPRIEFTVHDIAQNSGAVSVLGLSAPIQGRSEIEGRIICEKYNVKLHIIEKHVAEAKVVWLNQVIDGEGSKSVSDIDYSERSTIHILNSRKTYFQPILEVCLISNSEEGNLTKIDTSFRSRSNDTGFPLAELSTNRQSQEISEQGGLPKPLPLPEDFILNINSYHTSITESDTISARNSEILVIKDGSVDAENNEDKTALTMANKENNLEDGDDISDDIFSRRSGTSGISGQLYEITLLILFLLQGSKTARRFYLATNVKEAGDFDDVVLKYETKTGKSKVIFLQAKHRENPGKDKITVDQLFSESEKGDFNLKKYFNSYRKIKQQFLAGRKHEIFGSMFEEVDFIIYTNALSTFNKSEESVEKLVVEHDSVLNWLETRSYFYKLVTKGVINEKKISVLQYSSDCKKLAGKLAKSIFTPQGIVINEGILRDYHIPLAAEVIQREAGAKTGNFKESFLNSDSEFRKTFFEEVEKRNEFAGKSEDELKSVLQSKNIKLSDNFGKINTREGKYPESLPNDGVSEHDIMEFLSKLKLFVDQYSEEDLRKAVKQKVQEEYKVADQDIDSVFSDIQTKVLEWWKKGSRYLTDSNRIFQDAARVSIKFDVKEPVTLFTGRIRELGNLHKILQDGSEVVISQMASVTGLGGVGKSELARKYISKYNKDYDDNVIWINADTNITIAESFRRLAQEKLQISTTDENGKEKEIKFIVQDVYWFFAKRHRKSLFIFDNAGKYKAIGEAEGIDKFLPSHFNKPFGKNKPFVLITSRFQEWGDIEVLPLSVFTEEEAVEFITKALQNVVKLEEISIKRLAEELQYLPLALSQAVAYIKMENKGLNRWKEDKFTIVSYLELFKEKADELLSKLPGEVTDRYTKTVMTTWQVTIEKIKLKVCGKQALEVLDVIAYFAPNNIPIEQVFSNLISEGEERHTAVELLDQYSMAHLEYGWLNIHRLVQQVTRVELERQGKENEVVDKTFKLVYKSFPYKKDTLKDYSKQKELLPHLEAFLSHLEGLLIKHPLHKNKLEEYYIENLLTWMGDGYFNLGNPRRQMELLEQNLKIVEKHYSPSHYQVSTVLVNLSNAYWALGDNKKQKDLLERALEIDEKHYGPDHYLFARTLSNLGNCYKDLGDHQKQKEFLERVLEIEEKHYGSDHFEVASTLVNLSSAYSALGNTKKQRELLERALEIEEKYYEPDHYKLAKTLENLGIVHGALGDHQKQKKFIERALKIYENYYGSDHFEIAKTLINLSNAFGSLGDNKKRKELLERALEIEENHYGSDHFEVAGTLVNLAIAYGSLGDTKKRKGLLERALKIHEKHYGSDHYLFARTLNNLGNAYGDLGDTKRQKDLLERAVEIKEKHYGTDHFEVAGALVNLSNAYEGLGDYNKQKDLLERALEINENHYGSDYFEVARTLVNLSNAYMFLGDTVKQKDLLERALPILEKHYGLDHYFLAPALENLGTACGALGDHAKERELLERALDINEKHYGPDHFKVAGTQVNLSNSYRALGDTIKQKDVLEKALKTNEKHYGPNHFEVARTLANLGNYYRNLGDHEKQKELLKRAIEIKENHYGSDHFEVANTLASLSTAYHAVGDYKKQKDLLERALKIKEKHYGSDHYLLATTLEHLGVANGLLGDYQKQKELLERALDVNEKHYGSDHVKIATKLMNLGNTYGELGDPQTQIHLQERALKIQEKHYGPDHSEVAVTLVNLSFGYKDMGNNKVRKDLLERALEIQEKHYGSDHLNIADTLGRLSAACHALGDYKKQKDLLERALEIKEKHYGSDHVEIAGKLINLGNSYGELGDPQTQIQLQERALNIEEKHYGPDHYEIVGTLVNLSFAYRYLGDNKKQKDLLERALEIIRKHGSDHSEVAGILVNLGIAYGALGDKKTKKDFLEKALKLYEKCYGVDNCLFVEILVSLENSYYDLGNTKSQEDLPGGSSEIKEKQYGADYFEVFRTLVNLSNAYGGLGDTMKQKCLLQRALPGVEKHFGLDHYFLAITLEDLGTAYGASGDHQKEKDLLERALEINERHYGSNHFKVAGTLVNLSNAYRALGENIKQKDLLEKALEINEKHYGSDHYEVANTLASLGTTYRALGDYKKEKDFLERALKIMEEYYGSDHYLLATTLKNLGTACGALGDYQKEKDLLERALKINENNE